MYNFPFSVHYDTHARKCLGESLLNLCFSAFAVDGWLLNKTVWQIACNMHSIYRDSRQLSNAFQYQQWKTSPILPPSPHTAPLLLLYCFQNNQSSGWRGSVRERNETGWKTCGGGRSEWIIIWAGTVILVTTLQHPPCAQTDPYNKLANFLFLLHTGGDGGWLVAVLCIWWSVGAYYCRASTSLHSFSSLVGCFTPNNLN